MNLWKNRNWVPMLLSEVKNPFDSKEFIYEMKFDGHRAVIFVSPDTFLVQSRNKVDMTNKFPELKSIQKLVTKPTIFDGEIVLFENGSPNFAKLQARAHTKIPKKIEKMSVEDPVAFVCFDILYLEKALIELPLLERKKILAKFPNTDVFLKTFFIEEDGKGFFKEIKKKNLEGIVAKKRDSTYEINIRTENWIKIKNIQMKDFFIGGYKESEKGNVFSIYFGELINQKLTYVGKVFVAMKNPLYEELKKLKSKKNPFIDFKEDITFVLPKIKCEIEYLERSRSGGLRHAVFRGTKI